MVAFLKGVYGRAKEVDKFLMSQQPALRWWRSSFWDIRLSIACAATDVEYQNRILLRDNTLNLPVVARQPHPDPNHAPPSRRPTCPQHSAPRHASYLPMFLTLTVLPFFLRKFLDPARFFSNHTPPQVARSPLCISFCLVWFTSQLVSVA